MNSAYEWFLGQDVGFIRRFLNTTSLLSLRYVFVAGIAWFLAYRLFQHRWFHRKIIPRLPQGSDLRRELLYSLLTLGIFGLIGTATITAARQGCTRMYWKSSDHGWGWFVASIGCAILLHDTYFYWTHRLMHHRWLFPAFHRVHHRSTNPSPWAAYAFAPAEAVVEAGIFPLTVCLLPIHPLAFGLFMLWQIVFNVVGHTGFEFHPRWLMDSPLRWIVNTPTHHVMHHEKMRGNYGLYFNFWDRWMGTHHPEYETRFREVTPRSAREDLR